MIFIVIPVHNRKHLTSKCLASLQNQTVKDITVVVIDDGSTDGTSELIRQDFPEVVLLSGSGNLWWTEGTNVGVRYALQHSDLNKENFVLTLNDDTEVPTDYVSTLLQCYKKHKHCLIGSVSVDINNHESLQFAGTKINMNTAKELYLSDSKFSKSYKKLKQTSDYIESDSLPGRGVLIPIGVFKEIGLYDGEYFVHYMADFEFTIRAKKAGYKLIVSTESIVYEHVDASGLKIQTDLSLAKFWKGLWSIYSPINLVMRYHFAMRHAPNKWLYFTFDAGRIVTGYFLRRLRIMS